MEAPTMKWGWETPGEILLNKAVWIDTEFTAFVKTQYYFLFIDFTTVKEKEKLKNTPNSK